MVVAGAPQMTEAAISDVLAQTVPTKLLLVGQGLDYDFREHLERIAEANPETVFCWWFQPQVSLSAAWNRALRFAWECGAERAWVVNNDVRLARKTAEHLVVGMTATDALFVSAVAVSQEQFSDDLPQFRLDQRGGPDFSCFLVSKSCHEMVRFDENHFPAYAEDLTFHREMLLSGEGHRIFSLNIPYLHIGGGSGTLKSLAPDARAALERRIDGSRRYYERVWGGPVNHERFTIKGDPETAQDGVTTPELQRACLSDAPVGDAADSAIPSSTARN